MLKPILMLFDLDDTLFTTDAKIILRDPITGEKVYSLSTSEYREWKKEGKIAGHKLDFLEFSAEEKIINAVPRAGLDILRDACENPNVKIGILTARSDEAVVEVSLPKFLKKQNIDISIDPDLIFAVWDSKYTMPANYGDSERKLHVILQLIEERIFDSVFLIDDDPIHKRVIDEYCERQKIENIYVISVY